jgi:hypothetical protein
MRPLVLVLLLSGCATPVATSKTQDPGSIEMHRDASGGCTIRTPGVSPRDIDVNCMSGTVHTLPDKDYGVNWSQIGMALIALLSVVGL